MAHHLTLHSPGTSPAFPLLFQLLAMSSLLDQSEVDEGMCLQNTETRNELKNNNTKVQFAAFCRLRNQHSTKKTFIQCTKDYPNRKTGSRMKRWLFSQQNLMLFQRLRFSSHHSHSKQQAPVTPVPGNPMHSSR